ncbi:thiosulfate sulfurtransferase 16, chloroplastic-like [Cucurbita pepo subsp. pepo]|uniref:thiosulfate sulfurtransferase 16, chloroplastic-like n=1 Tax=Cucurbita pepo subsp. pepo TaxID=3664 RepID=UPI000C9D8735|nr:thiosulfate sulfurtransferase 16, chloroplastic-like [Cucurbita pepo subsp. pepo]
MSHASLPSLITSISLFLLPSNNNLTPTGRLLPITDSLHRRRRCSGVSHEHSSTSRNAILRKPVQATTAPTSVPVRVALELLQAGYRYLDVRTPEEFSAGHAPAAINIPYLHRVGSEMTRNPHFLAEVAIHFREDDEIIVGSRRGKRSRLAAADLLASGYRYVMDISGGYEAWSCNGLPMGSSK